MAEDGGLDWIIGTVGEGVRLLGNVLPARYQVGRVGSFVLVTNTRSGARWHCYPKQLRAARFLLEWAAWQQRGEEGQEFYQHPDWQEVLLRNSDREDGGPE